jgi:hypothetical protein
MNSIITEEAHPFHIQIAQYIKAYVQRHQFDSVTILAVGALNLLVIILYLRLAQSLLLCPMFEPSH